MSDLSKLTISELNRRIGETRIWLDDHTQEIGKNKDIRGREITQAWVEKYTVVLKAYEALEDELRTRK